MACGKCYRQHGLGAVGAVGAVADLQMQYKYSVSNWDCALGLFDYKSVSSV